MTQQAATRKKGFRLFEYIGEIINELKKVVWLSRREATYLTVLVLIVTLVSTAVLGLLDYGFTNLVDRLFLGG